MGGKQLKVATVWKIEVMDGLRPENEKYSEGWTMVKCGREGLDEVNWVGWE